MATCWHRNALAGIWTQFHGNRGLCPRDVVLPAGATIIELAAHDPMHQTYIVEWPREDSPHCCYSAFAVSTLLF